MTPLPTYWRVRVRASAYRGVQGWSVTAREYTAAGVRVNGWPVKIFAETRAQAEAVRDAYKDAALTREARNARVDAILRVD